MTAPIENAPPIMEPQMVEELMQLQSKVVRTAEGQIVEAFGDRMRLILTSEDTNGEIALGFDETSASFGPPLHVHAREDEIWIVQSGRYEFQIAGECMEVEPGTVVFGPRDIPHTFRVVSDIPGHQYIVTFPAGFDCFFKRSAKEFATGAPDTKKIFHIAAEHGITFLTSESAADYYMTQMTSGIENRTMSKPKIVRNSEGEIIRVFGERIRLILSSEDTGGQLVLGELETPSGVGPPLHVHTREDEIFIIQNGLYQFQIGNECFEAGPGTVVYAPRGMPHRFRVISEISGRLLGAALPGGIEQFVVRCAQASIAGDLDWMKVARIASEYGITYLLPQG